MQSSLPDITMAPPPPPMKTNGQREVLDSSRPPTRRMGVRRCRWWLGLLVVPAAVTTTTSSGNAIFFFAHAQQQRQASTEFEDEEPLADPYFVRTTDLHQEDPPEIDVTPAPFSSPPPTPSPTQQPEPEEEEDEEQRELTLAPLPTRAPLTPRPTPKPTRKPRTPRPTRRPRTPEPTPEPTGAPTPSPTRPPTLEPTRPPTSNPTRPPTLSPTGPPTLSPTEPPTVSPTRAPTPNPTTREPTDPPTPSPTPAPTPSPTTPAPTTIEPTASPTPRPTTPQPTSPPSSAETTIISTDADTAPSPSSPEPPAATPATGTAPPTPSPTAPSTPLVHRTPLPSIFPSPTTDAPGPASSGAPSPPPGNMGTDSNSNNSSNNNSNGGGDDQERDPPGAAAGPGKDPADTDGGAGNNGGGNDESAAGAGAGGAGETTFVTSHVPIEFDASIVETGDNGGNNGGGPSSGNLTAIGEIWGEYILQRLQASYRKDPELNPESVELVVTLQQRRRKERSLRQRQLQVRHQQQQQQQPRSWLRKLRRLQQSSGGGRGGDEPGNTFSLNSKGRVGLSVASTRFVEDNGEIRRGVLDELDSILTPQGLNQALVLADYQPPTTVTAVDNESGRAGDSDSTSAVSADENGTSQSTTGHVPTMAEKVVGFMLLGLTILSLFFWAHVLYKKRMKRKRKKRQQEIIRQRQMGILAKPPTTGSARQSTSPSRIPARRDMRPVVGPQVTSPSSSDSSDVYNGLESDESQGDSNNDGDADGDDGSDDDTEDISEFGMELRNAVELDNAAWEEFLRKKEQAAELERDELQAELRSAEPADLRVVSAVTPIIRVVPASPPRQERAASVASVAPSEEGFEVDVDGTPALRRIRSFPYGDEKEADLSSPATAAAVASTPMTTSNSPRSRRVKGDNELELSLDDAVEWTETGISLKVPEDAQNEDGLMIGDGEFSPYGDSKVDLKKHQDAVIPLAASWDLDAAPVTDTDGPSQYSFMYPLTRQELSDNTPSTMVGSGGQYGGGSSSSPSSGAVRGSPTVSSWSTGNNVAGPAATRFPGNPEQQQQGYDTQQRDVGGDDRDVESDRSEEDDLGDTAEMLKEVMELSQYVKRYEHRKELHRNQEISATFLTNTTGTNTTNPNERTISFATNTNERTISSLNDTTWNASTSMEDSTPASARYETSINESTLSSGAFRKSMLPAPTKPSAARRADDDKQNATDQPTKPTVSRRAKAATHKATDQPTKPSAVHRAEAATQKATDLPVRAAISAPGARRFDNDSSMDAHLQYQYEDEAGDPSLEEPESTSVSSNSMEDEDDTSQRLGISRYSVERPMVPRMAFSPSETTKRIIEQQGSSGAVTSSTPVVSPDSNPHATARLSNKDPLYEDEGPNLQGRIRSRGSPREGTVRPGVLPRSGTLSSMRKSNVPFLDSTMSGETGMSSARPLEETLSSADGQAATQQEEEGDDDATNALRRWMSKFESSPRARTNNRNFNNIVTMFDSKPADAIVPPNERWQYEK